MPVVNYDRDTYNMCLCGGCPVNRSSACVARQERALAPLIEQIESRSLMPDAKALPGVYCATGKAACDDLDGDRSCLCPACPVFIDEGLKNSYFCFMGSAAEVEK